jgi:hypothetical protein
LHGRHSLNRIAPPLRGAFLFHNPLPGHCAGFFLFLHRLASILRGALIALDYTAKKGPHSGFIFAQV